MWKKQSKDKIVAVGKLTVMPEAVEQMEMQAPGSGEGRTPS